MASDSFKIKNSINISANSSSVSESGDLRRRSSDDELAYHDGEGETVVVTARNISSYESTVSAGDVSVTPTGDIAATDVQAAIAELDSEKEPTLTKGDLTEDTSSVLTITGSTSAVIGSGTSIRVTQAASGVDGYLSGTDWDTFNGKSDYVDPLTTNGDLVYYNSGTSRLSVGSEGDILTVSSGLPAWTAPGALTVTSQSTSYTVLTTDDVIIGDATSGSITMTLPASAANTGKEYIFKKVDTTANPIIIDANGSETIDNELTFSIYGGSSHYGIVSDGTEWKVIRGFEQAKSEVLFDTGNGHGSTATHIRNYSNVTQTGSALTGTTDSTNGASVTVNEPGLYGIGVADRGSGTAIGFGISINASSLTTSIISLTRANGKVDVGSAPSGVYGSIYREVRLYPGDVVRAHTDSTPNTSTENQSFRVIKLGP